MPYLSNAEKVARALIGSKKPLKASQTVAVPATNGTATATINVPAGRRYYIKQVNVTKGANTTINAQNFDGAPTSQAASYACDTVFGALLTAESSIDLRGTNAGAAAESLTLEVIGYDMEA